MIVYSPMHQRTLWEITLNESYVSDNSRVSTLMVCMDFDRYGHTEVICEYYDMDQCVMNPKVNGAAESQVLPLHIYCHLFLQQLSSDGLPKPSALTPTNIRLKAYTYLYINCYGTTTPQVAHYKTEKLDNFTWFVMKKKKIILGLLASNRLSLTKVLCHNKV